MTIIMILQRIYLSIVLLSIIWIGTSTIPCMGRCVNGAYAFHLPIMILNHVRISKLSFTRTRPSYSRILHRTRSEYNIIRKNHQYQFVSMSSMSEQEQGQQLQQHPTSSINQSNLRMMTHDDIIWKLRPTSEMIDNNPDVINQWRINAQAFHSMMMNNNYNESDDEKDETYLRILCPPGGQAILEAYDKHVMNHDDNNNNNNSSLIGRFGIITQPGPAVGEIQQTIRLLYQDEVLLDENENDNDEDDDDSNNSRPIGIGAIKYMFVNQEYRSRNIGTLALQMISYIHSCQNCDYCILVADDKTNESNNNNNTKRLVSWYERCGNYTIAPLLQNFLGSPNEIYGISMIAPILQNQRLPSSNCTFIWWE